MRTTPLEHDRTRLRPMCHADATRYATGTTDPAVRKFAHLPVSEYTPETVRSLIDDHGDPTLSPGHVVLLTLAEASTDTFVGSLVFFDITGSCAEVGFWLHPDARGHGHAATGLRLAGEYAQSQGFRVLVARTVVDNPASQNCLRGAGFIEYKREPGTTPAGERCQLIHYHKTLTPPVELPLRTERLTLRRHQPTDAEWLHRIYSRDDVTRHLLHGPLTRKDVDTLVHERLTKTELASGSGSLALVVDADGQPVGDVSLWLTDRIHGIAEIGWVLDPAHGGRGYASEAVAAILDLAFNHYRLHRVIAQMDARNTRSARLAARVGMRLEAHHRRDWWSKNDWTDTLIYAMLADDHHNRDTAGSEAREALATVRANAKQRIRDTIYERIPELRPGCNVE